MTDPGEFPIVDCIDGRVISLDNNNNLKKQPKKSKRSSNKLLESSCCPGEIPVSH